MTDVLKENYRIMNIQNINLNGRDIFVGDYYELSEDCFVFVGKIESNDLDWSQAIKEMGLV